MVVVENATNPPRFAHFWQGPQSLAPATRNDIWTSKNRNALRATTAYTFSTSQLPKVVRQWCALYILTWKCASRHNGVHFFDISTSKIAPRPRCFAHFDLQMNGVQFFISHLASWLRTRRFSEPTFWPSGATNHWKNSVSRLSYLFAHLHLLSSDSFSSDLLSSNLSLLSASSLLCFSSVHIVGSLTSKLPSINNDTHSIRIYWAELTIAGTNGYKNWDILCKRYFTPPKSNTQPPDEFTTAYGPSPFWVACQLLGYQWAVVG